MSAKRALCHALYEDEGADHRPNPGKRVRGGGECMECGGFIPNEKKSTPAQIEIPETAANGADQSETVTPDHTYVVNGISWTII